MALSLITSIPATCYTSQLQEIDLASTTGTTVTLTINHQAQMYYSGNGQTRVFQATYSTPPAITPLQALINALQNENQQLKNLLRHALADRAQNFLQL